MSRIQPPIPPPEELMQEWLTPSDCAEVMKMTERGIRKKAEREQWRSRRVPRDGGGPPALEYHVSALPAEAREALVKRHLRSPVAGAGERAAEAMRLAEELTQERRDARLQESLAEAQAMDGAEQQRMEARLVVLRTLSSFEEALPDVTQKDLLARFCAAYHERDLGLETPVTDEVPSVSPRTLLRWKKRLEKDGPAALAGAYGRRSKRTYERLIEDDTELCAYALGMVKNYGPHVNARNVRRALVARFGIERVPSGRTVQRFIDRWRTEHDQVASYLDSPEMWRSKRLAAFGRLDDGVERPNQVWELDSTLADIALVERLPDGETRERRYALVQAIDVYTRRVKFIVCRSSAASAIALLLRKAMLDWGVPELLRIDNGKDYTSNHLATLTQVLGIDIHHCRPFEPQEKPFVERAFRTLQSGAMALLPGFVGHDVAGRKKLRARERARQKAGAPPIDLGAVGLGPIELQVWLDEWAENQYGRDRHDGIGCSPLERLQSYRGRLRRITNERALDCLLEPVPGRGGRRVVQKSGVQVGRADDGRDIFYVAPEMAPYIGQEVLVFYDPYEAGRVCLYGGVDTQFICWAVDPETPAERRQIAVAGRRAQQAALRAELRDLDRTSSGSGVDQAWMEIAVSRSLDAARLTVLPKQADPHETPALRAAENAADEARRQEEAKIRPLPTANPPEVQREIARLQERAKEDPSLVRPRFWDNDTHRYAWCRNAVQKGRPDLLTDRDWSAAREHEDLLGLEAEARLDAITRRYGTTT